MRVFLPVLISLSFVLAGAARGAEVSEEERLRGFAEHNRRKKEFEKQRETGTEEIKKKRQKWDEDLQKAVGPYKEWKSKQGKVPDETSREYELDVQSKKKRDEDLEKARQQYVRDRDSARARRKSTVRLSEEEEYDLTTSWAQRADPNKRKQGLVGSQSGSGARSRPGGTGSADFGGPPPMDYNPPPPPPPPPEFYEPEVPPPPPPPPPGFDDPIPPPIFEDQGGDF